VRWNLSKGRIDQAKNTLRRLAEVNGKPISETSLDNLAMADNESKDSFFQVFKSTTLFLRLIICFFCWITCTFLFYGLTLNSVALAGNTYLDFILTSLVEIPAAFVCNYVVDKFGRKWSLSCSFFLTGLSCLVFLFLPMGEPVLPLSHLSNINLAVDSEGGRLAVYLIGKFGATAAFL
jgi:hypothetical protein